jgi:phosphohistidine phosphatase
LLLLRHAKSSWAASGTPDHDRPLNARGQRTAPLVGAYLREHGLVPEVVLCSSARRTCETLALLGLGDDPEIVVSHSLYHATPRSVLELVHGVDDDVRTLMVLGHNPTSHELAIDLASTGEAAALDALRQEFPTAALAVLSIDGAWSALQPGSARLDAFVVPRALR